MTTETPSPSAPSPAPSKGKVFLHRLTSSLALWTVVLGALFGGSKLVADDPKSAIAQLELFNKVHAVLAGEG